VKRTQTERLTSSEGTLTALPPIPMMHHTIGTVTESCPDRSPPPVVTKGVSEVHHCTCCLCAGSKDKANENYDTDIFSDDEDWCPDEVPSDDGCDDSNMDSSLNKV